MPNDPYLYPGTSVLINKRGIRNQEALDRFERLVTTAARETLPRVEVSPDGLRQVHRHLFANVYDWAGKDRTIGMVKTFAADDPRRFSFVPRDEISSRLDRLFAKILSDDRLRTSNIPDFANALAPHFRELNVIHPFREGNGRTQRIMLTRIAESHGHKLDLTVITGTRMDQDSIDAAVKNDPKPLANLIRDAANPITRIEMTRMRSAFDKAYKGDVSNDFYIEHGRIGQEIAGTLVMTGQGLAAVLDERSGRIAIGEVTDLSSPNAAPGADIVLRPSEQSLGNRIARELDNVPEQEARTFPPLQQAIRAMNEVRTLAMKHPPQTRSQILDNAPKQIASAINDGINPETVALRIAEGPKPKIEPRTEPKGGPKMG